jgi:hypothetical protein
MSAVLERSTAVAPIANGGVLATSGTHMAMAEILEREKVIQEVMKAVMKEDVHFGKIPGTNKPTLYKAGAEKLCTVFRIAPTYQVEDLSTDDCVRYRVTCYGTSQVSGVMLGTGMGECSSDEEKYRWIRAYEREWNETPDTRRRKQHGWDKNARKEYEVLQVRTEPASMANTVLKMANKRAYIAMVLAVLAASDIFAQDLEDMEERLRKHLAGGEDEDDKGAGGDKGSGGRKGGGASGGAGSGGDQTVYYDAKQFEQNLPKWRQRIQAGTKTPKDYIDWLEAAGITLTQDQKEVLNACAKKEGDPPQAAESSKATGTTTSTSAASDDPFSAPTFAEVADKIARAQTIEKLELTGDLIRAVENAEHRTELQQKYEARESELKGGAEQ